MPSITLKMRGLDLVGPGLVVPRDPGALRVSQLQATYRVPTLGVTIRGDTVISPAKDDYVILKDPLGATVFGGKVKQIKRTVKPVGRVFYDVVAQGWEAIFEGLPVTVARTFPAGTPDSYMLSVLLADNYGPISTTAVPVLYSFRADMPLMQFDTSGDGKGTLGRAVRRILKEAGNESFWIDGDKVPHYNDVGGEAPYVLVSTGADDIKTVDFKEDVFVAEDEAQRPVRIRVIGFGGVEYTATDWMEWNSVQKSMSTEPGTPTERIWQLPDELDVNLLTVDDCMVRGFKRLNENRVGRKITVRTRGHGFRPGQLIAIAQPLLPPIPYVGDYHAVSNDTVYPHRYDNLHLTMGWLQIQTVNPTMLDHNRVQYVLECGDPQPQFEDTLLQSAKLEGP